MRKVKDLQILQQEAEAKAIAETPAITTTQETVTADPQTTTGTPMKKKNLVPDDDEGFITVKQKKDKR
ncbi:hypothetical protein CEXT_47591, partial [Caerostris extrusa]